MYKYSSKLITLFTLFCFINMTFLEGSVIYEINSHRALQKVGLAQAKGWLFPYYLGKMCIYIYRINKLKKSDIKGHVKLAKKCKKYSKKLGYKLRIGDYIEDICQSLEEKTGYSLSDAKKDLKKKFKTKRRKGVKLNSSKEEDIDFNNPVEKSIMEIVEKKGEITQEEYLECLRMDPEIDIDYITSPQNHLEELERISSILKEKYPDREKHDGLNCRHVTFELSCYITAACVGGFLAMIPIPPINSFGGWIFGTAMVSAGNIIFHEYCERLEQDQDSEKKSGAVK